jgi:hypothetical protein
MVQVDGDDTEEEDEVIVIDRESDNRCLERSKEWIWSMSLN